jgi:hypothetical protein
MEEYMSRKTKRHRNQTDSNTGNEMNVQKGTDLSMSNLGEQAQSALDSVRETAADNKLLLSLVGVGVGIAGAALFLLKTERGQAIQEQIGETITDSMGRIRDLSVTGWTYVRDFITEPETDQEIESEVERLRRVS